MSIYFEQFLKDIDNIPKGKGKPRNFDARARKNKAPYTPAEVYGVLRMLGPALLKTAYVAARNARGKDPVPLTYFDPQREDPCDYDSKKRGSSDDTYWR